MQSHTLHFWRAARRVSPLCFVFLVCSCVSWKPGWEHAMIVPGSQDVSAQIEQARALEKEADNADKVRALIQAYEAVVNADPTHYEALWKIGNYHMLMGATYAENNRQKKHHYLEAIRYCERAMFTNADFRDAVRDEIPLWEACDRLTIGEIDAMGYWYTAVFYYFGECLSPWGRMLNTRLMVRIEPVIQRIDELDPNWAGGANTFSRAIYKIAIPERFGGSKPEAEALFAKAITMGPDYLVNRWGRARYLYPLTGNRAGYVEDLEWVLQQDPHTAPLPYPWNAYFQAQARIMLNDVDRVFEP